VYERKDLAAGARVDGPAVIEEFGSTTVVLAGQQLLVDAHGIMVIRRVSPAVVSEAEVRR